MSDAAELAKTLGVQAEVAKLCEACPEHKALVVEILRKIVDGKGAGAPSDAAGTAPSAPEKVERTEGWCTITSQSFQVPRGSLDVELLVDGSIGLHSKSVNVILPPNGIQFAYELPSVNSAASSILLHLHTAIQVGKSETRTLLLTPKPSPKSKLLRVELRQSAPGNPTLSEAVEEEPVQVWRMLLASMSPAVVLREPDPTYFRGNQGKTALKCYHNVKDGVLYPLPDGIAFVRSPTLFLALPEIERVDLQREVSGATRNFDLNIVMKEGTTHEIRMIERDEFEPISAYVAKTRINDDVQATNDAEAGGAEDNAGSDSDGEDSDFQDSDSEDDKVKKEAGADEDDDDDDDDDDDGGDSSDGEDHESDIDSSDIDLDKNVTLDETDTIALKRPKRKAALAAFPASSATSAEDASESKRVKSEQA